MLVNNAGILINGGIDEVALEDFENSLRVNVVSCFELIKAFLPEMISNDYGRIVNISSGWGSFAEGLSGPISYSVSKAALNALTLSVSQSLPSGVKINSMCPGWVRTTNGR